MFRGWVEGVEHSWIGPTRGDQLGNTAVIHNAMHMCEAITVRGLAGFGLSI